MKTTIGFASNHQFKANRVWLVNIIFSMLYFMSAWTLRTFCQSGHCSSMSFFEKQIRFSNVSLDNLRCVCFSNQELLKSNYQYKEWLIWCDNSPPIHLWQCLAIICMVIGCPKRCFPTAVSQKKCTENSDKCEFTQYKRQSHRMQRRTTIVIFGKDEKVQSQNYWHRFREKGI